jgi:hypothetical protein
VAREAGTTFALGVGVTIAGTAAVGAGIVSAPFALAVGGIALTASAGASYLNRWEEASSNGIFHEHGRIGLAAIGDAVGLSGLYEGTVGRSIITDCSLTEEEQSRRLGRGLGSVAAIGTAPRAARFGTNLGQNARVQNLSFGPTSPPSPFSPRVQEILGDIQAGVDNGNFTIRQNSLNPETLQESNVTIDFGDGRGVNLRTETHPLQQGGSPIRHTNVEVTRRTPRGRNKVIENIHITE